MIVTPQVKEPDGGRAIVGPKVLGSLPLTINLQVQGFNEEVAVHNGHVGVEAVLVQRRELHLSQKKLDRGEETNKQLKQKGVVRADAVVTDQTNISGEKLTSALHFVNTVSMDSLGSVLDQCCIANVTSAATPRIKVMLLAAI